MRPETEGELVEAIRGAKGALAVRGGGTRAPRWPEGEVLETSGLRGVTLYEPGALTIVAAAGTALAEIEAVLAAEGQRLPFEPADMRGVLGREGASTIGGVVAANASGPRRIQAGACRDSLIGVRFVDGAGTVIKNGGRVMKNVTGYDLVKLMAGSWGTLGVLSEVAFKVLPIPEAAATIELEGLDDRSAVRAMARALGSPFEVTGAAHQAARTMLRIEGFEASVQYRAGQLCALLREFGAAEVERHEADDPWAGVRDLALYHGRGGDLWRLSVKPGDAPEIVERCGAEAVSYDWAGGLIWALMPAGVDLRARLGEFSGHATLIRADGAAQPVFQPEPPALAAIAAGLRAKFDPRGILNPGLMG